MDIKGAAVVGSDGNQEHVTEGQRKRDACYIMSKNLGELYPTVMYMQKANLQMKD